MVLRHGAAATLLVLAACTPAAPTDSKLGMRPVKRAIGQVPASEVATWKQLVPPLFPSPRSGYAMAYNPAAGKTYVFGGTDLVASQNVADLWAWDGAVWAQLITKIAPAARAGAAMAYDSARESLVLHGGLCAAGTAGSTAGTCDATWEWTPNGGWSVVGATTTPGTVYGHAMVTDTTRNKLVLYGGYFLEGQSPDNSGAPRWRNDVWEWDGTDSTWTRRTPAATTATFDLVGSPPLMTYDEARRRVFLYSPVQLADGSSLFKFLEWDPVSAGWASRDGQTGLGTDTAGPWALAYDPVRRRQVFFVDDWQTTHVWEVDARVPTWYVRDPPTAPGSNPTLCTMVYDSGRSTMVLWRPLVYGQEMWEYRVSHLGNGEGCTASTAGTCESGNCVDGVCCATAACTGTCTACNVPGAEGTCARVAAGAERAGSCGSGQACDGSGACKAKNGTACTSAGACASGICVDGVCCDSACAGPCVACNLAGQEGTCRPHTAGTDPQSDCATASGLCQPTCDGAGACAAPKEAVACATCVTCDGLGSCAAYDHACAVPSGGAAVPDCYLDSVGGDDGHSGLSAAEAVKTQAHLPATCVAVHVKRGSSFAEKLRLLDHATSYGNYGDVNLPLPRFVVPPGANSGPVVAAMGKAAVTFDGLYIAGAKGDGTTTGLPAGVCVALGYANTLTNSEIAGCDTGVVLYDDANTVAGNYIHDLNPATVPPANPYLSGSATGVVVKAGASTVAWNTFVNCKGALPSGAGADCYGGAVAIALRLDGTSGRVDVNHNYAEGNCGFAALAAPQGSAGGVSYVPWTFDRNMVVDSGWLALIDFDASDIVSCELSSNTLVQHQGSPNAGKVVLPRPGAAATTLPASGLDLRCNLVAIDGGLAVVGGVDKLLAQGLTNLVLDSTKQSAGFVNGKGTLPSDYDLVATSPAVDACGIYLSPEDFALGQRRDFFNRKSPGGNGTKLDVGACEYGGDPSDPPKFFPGLGGAGGAGTGAGGTGGATALDAGGLDGPRATGAGGASGTIDAERGDPRAALDLASDTTPISIGGSPGAGGTTTSAGTGGATMLAGAGGTHGTGGTTTAVSALDAGNRDALVTGGAGGSATTTKPVTGLHHGCSCALDRRRSGAALWLLLTFAIFRWRWRRAPARESSG